MARFCICQQQKSSFLTLSQDERSKRLLEAAADGQVRQFELLIQAEANLDYQEDEGKTALQKAVLSNSQDFVELLLENRPNINTKDKEDRTALYFATEAGHYLLVEYLFRTGIWGPALHTASATG